jgi:hypothetical protein
MHRSLVTAAVALLACVTASGQAPSAPYAPQAPNAPYTPTLAPDRLTLIEPLVTQSIADHQLPGVVVVAGTIAVTTVAGGLFAYLRMRSGSLIAPIFGHIATNSFAYIAALVVLGL